ncbi:hypothetical protein [Pseudomonas izuensis]|uniref:Uncharacterized protein n=1 Tax=Pseudomonas izuensis TaxID=2684212 RepID=A0ABM7S0B2_9PSED|nr:hypothetical protein [Pseudomonas izuensis]BCX71301.1 hypothetical protein LAB08_R59890 [Pseudomonas izuensis]
MSITTKDWTAQIATREPNAYLRVTGAISGPRVKLVRSLRQVSNYDLRLDLEIDLLNEDTLHIVSDLPIEYKAMGNHNITGVSIFHEGNLIHHINKILITY